MVESVKEAIAEARKALDMIDMESLTDYQRSELEDVIDELNEFEESLSMDEETYYGRFK